MGVERDGDGRSVRREASSDEEVSRRFRQHGRAALHDLTQKSITPVETEVADLLRSVLRADGEVVVGRVGTQHQECRVRRREFPRALSDQPQRVVLTRAGQELVPDLRRCFQPLLPQPALLEQIGVVHRDPGRRREGLDQDLVVRGELPAALLLGQVQVAEHCVTHPDGHPKEGAHRRVVRREADRCVMPAQVGQPQRSLAEDELAEQTLSFREAPHPCPDGLVQPDVDEPGDTSGRAEHAECPVPGVDEIHRSLHDAAQRGLQLQARGDGEDRVEQALHPPPRRDDLGEPLLHLAQQLIKPQAGLHVGHRWQRRVGHRRTTRGCVVCAVRHADPLSLLVRCWRRTPAQRGTAEVPGQRTVGRHHHRSAVARAGPFGRSRAGGNAETSSRSGATGVEP
jgi:hypothetical protein